jgi:hypothetical protein
MTNKPTSDFSKLSSQDLIRLYSQVISELKQRNVIHSKNIIGDLGENIAIEFYNSTPGLPNLQAAPASTQNIDAISKKGERYSIKTTTSKTTGVFYGLPPNGSSEELLPKFEYVIIVRMNADYDLLGIYELTWKQFLKFKKWHSRMTAWNLSITRKVLVESKKVFESPENPQG